MDLEKYEKTERNFLNELYELYKDLLSANDRFIYEYRFILNQPVKEVMRETGKSSQTISITTKRVDDRLYFFEKKLHVYHLRKKIDELEENND